MAIRRISLIPHTHHDVGYTNSPRIIDRMHRRIVDRVLDLVEQDPATDPASLRWTFEAARPVASFLETAAPEQRRRFFAQLSAGRLSVTAGYLNMTQLPDAPEHDEMFRVVRALQAQGIPVRTQQHGDVNGISWGATDPMLDAGVTRLVMALNPDHGRAPFTQPSAFQWETPSGRRVFVWLSTHYGYGEEWGIVQGDVSHALPRIEEFVSALDGRDDYPFSTAVVHAGNDNRWPTRGPAAVVEAWNAKHPDLPMACETIDDALDAIQAEASTAELPVVRGEWADWWSHGHGSTAREVAVYREARTLLRQAETDFALARLAGEGGGEGEIAFSEVLGYRRAPVRLRTAAEVDADLAEVRECLLLYGEHTWGSWETYSKPHSTFSHSHHNAKSSFAYAAYDFGRDLAIEAWHRLLRVGANEPELEGRVLVFNPSPHARTETMDVEVDDGTRRVAVSATVPAFGAVSVEVPAPGEWAPAPESVAAGRYEVTVRPESGGVVSIVDRTNGRELVDGEAAWGLGAVVTEEIPSDSAHPAVTVSPKLFHPDHPGPEFVRAAASGDGPVLVRVVGPVTQLRWESALTGIQAIVSTLTITEGAPDLELAVRISKAERFAPESVHIAFPFAVRSPRFLLETAGAVFEADHEQLPDTSRDWYSVQHAIGVGGEDGGMLWGTYDAPLVQLGALHTGEWARRLVAPRGHIQSWIANNLHFTNFQARQEFTRAFRYRFRPAEVTRATVRGYAADLAQPLQPRFVRGEQRPFAAPVSVTPDDLLTEFRPAPDGGLRVRLRNPGDAPVAPLITAPAGWEVESPAEIPAFGNGEAFIRRTGS
ncbi:hypothetical protein M3147_13450 [Agromyces mediolanus]|uniref:glycoside hydrolase family 38 N-terminal domain-containing protein n=1 Tax=Agromyces mediolanus TaxID=41986 RepID=UPI00203C5EEB|nr:hypothetical protein [Agromyces mediolanus]MCM3658254.1 hypothetical protein [Agromyces mediolanus]